MYIPPECSSSFLCWCPGPWDLALWTKKSTLLNWEHVILITRAEQQRQAWQKVSTQLCCAAWCSLLCGGSCRWGLGGSSHCSSLGFSPVFSHRKLGLYAMGGAMKHGLSRIIQHLGVAAKKANCQQNNHLFQRESRGVVFLFITCSYQKCLQPEIDVSQIPKFTSAQTSKQPSKGPNPKC